MLLFTQYETTSLRGHAPQFFLKSSHVSLLEAVSPKIYCCLPKIKHFGPKKNLGWIRHWVTISVSLHHLSCGQQSHAEIRIICRKSQHEVNLWRFVACYCYATKSTSRTMRSQVSFWVCRRRSGPEWTVNSSLYHTRTVKLGSFSFAARSFRKSPAWNCFHLFATIRAWLIIQQ